MKRFKKVWSFLAALLIIGILALSGCGAGGGGGSSSGGGGGSDPTGRSISGKVMEVNGATPLNNAFIALYLNSRAETPYLTTTSDSNGNYIFSNIPQTSCMVKFWRTQANYNSSPDNPLGVTLIKTTTGNITNANVTAGRYDPEINTVNPPQGSVGSQVTITGENFGSAQGTSTITFNGVNAGSAASWSQARLVCSIPPGASTGNLVITVNGQTSNGVAFTVSSTPITLNSIAITPITAGISQGQTQQYTAIGTYSDASTLDITSQVAWNCDNAAAGSININGLFTALSSITSTKIAHITATLSGKTSNQADLTVTYSSSPPILTSINITPTAPSLSMGQTQQFTAIGYYSDSSSQNITSQVTWNSGNVGAGSINLNGLFTAASSITSTQIVYISATKSGITSNQATITVTYVPPILVSITINPDRINIFPGGTQQFNAVGNYNDGSSSVITGQVTWQCDNSSAGSISNVGLFTALGSINSSITAHVTARYGGIVSNQSALLISILQWQKCLGGSESDGSYSIKSTGDGGYILTGVVSSNNGDVTGNHGVVDAWVVKMTSNGSIQWQKCLGGSAYDFANSIQQTSDGGFIISGYTESNDGDVTGNHGLGDAWVVKLSSNGNIEWQKCIGGSNEDRANYVQQTTDGGYIMAGYTNSNDGNVYGNHGSNDVWLVKLTSNGILQWQKCIGGSNVDRANYVQQTNDSGYIIAGYSYSTDGDIIGNHGQDDVLVLKLSSSGNIQWQKCLGGSAYDAANAIQQTSDGGYIMAGFTISNNGDVSGSHGDYEAWIVRLNTSGNMQWQKCLGGTKGDYGNAIQPTTDGGYILGGYTSSNDGNVTGNHGGEDAWAVKLSSSGDIQWQKCFGGSTNNSWETNQDRFYSVQQNSDGGYILAGLTNSNNNGDVLGNHGKGDIWVIKIFPITTP